MGSVLSSHRCDAVPDDASRATAVSNSGLKKEKMENEDAQNDVNDNTELRRCGCHKHYPPRIPSLAFNDTSKNRALCKVLRAAKESPSRAFAYSNLEDGRGALRMPLVGRTWVKTGDKHGLAEASTMRWVARHTSIPVPHVICALEHKSGRTSIVMEAVAGRPLWETWDKRSPESKQRILAQLKCMVDEMRALPPAARFETVDGGPLYGGSLCSWNETYPAMYGPCESFHTLHHQLQRNIYHHEDAANDEALDAEERENPNSENGPPNVAPQYSDDATCPPPVFTHGRLTPFNIWADRDTVTGIIQWQNAGWWPDYWEYANCMSSLAHIFAPEWASEKDQFLAPFPEGEAMEKERQNWYTPCCCSC